MSELRMMLRSRNFYSCRQCQKSFTHKDFRTRHICIRTKVKRKCFRCEACSNRFYYKYSLKRHLQIHMRRSPYSCWECNEKVIEYSGFIEHLKSSHPRVKLLKCDQCKRVFNVMNMYKMHRKSHLVQKSSITSKRPVIPETPRIPVAPINPQILLEAPTLVALLTQNRPSAQVVSLGGEQSRINRENEVVEIHEEGNLLIQPSTSYQYEQRSSGLESLTKPDMPPTRIENLSEIRYYVLTQASECYTGGQIPVSYPLHFISAETTQDENPSEGRKLVQTISKTAPQNQSDMSHSEDRNPFIPFYQYQQSSSESKSLTKHNISHTFVGRLKDQLNPLLSGGSSGEQTPSAELPDLIQADALQNAEHTTAERKLLTCNRCDYRTHNSLEWVRHVSSHSVHKNNQPLPVAGNLIVQSSPLLRTHHEDNSGERIPCVNPSGFFRTETLQSTKRTTTERQLYTCDECSFSCYDSSELEAHKLIHFKNTNERSRTVVKNQSSPLLITLSDSDSSEKQTPNINPSGFNPVEVLQNVRHITTATHTCNLCPFSSYDEREHSTHVLGHFVNVDESKPSPITVNILIDQSSPLLLTQPEDNSENQTPCVDSSRLNQEEILQNAEHTTPERELYTCDECSFSCYDSSEMETHRLIHFGENYP